MDFGNIEKIIYTWMLTNGIKTLLILIFIFISRKIANTAIKKILHIHKKTNVCEEYNKKLQTVYSIIHSLVDFVIIAVGTMLVLNELGINIGPILAAAGVLGVAVGFGAKRL